MIGKTVSHYRMLAKLGAGGMGEVYLAEDTILGRKVAIKVLPPASGTDEHAAKRLIREAQAAATLDHPGICAIYEAGADGELTFIVMQYIEGETLHSRIQRGPLELKEVLDIAIPAADALVAAHARGIIHRDIKPQNIMITPRGQPKIMDFGLARIAAAGSESETASVLTGSGVVMGTVPYMSPEQLRGDFVDGRSDIFSFGVVLYEMITGKRPFQGRTAAETMVGILTLEPPLSGASGVPAPMQAILQKCLAKSCAGRYGTAQDLVADLRRVATGASVEPPAARPVPSIAVLPFVNMSTDAENEYFCDGLAEELIHALAKVEGLKVAARTSAFSFKGKEKHVREIGQTLKVGTVLEGGVRRSSNRLRVTARLVAVEDGYQLWSERYDRQMEDVFDIQDQISLAIVNALKVTLLGHEEQALSKRYTDNPKTYELYLRGRFHMSKFTEEGFSRAIGYFDESLVQSPDFAPAYAGLAQCYTVAAFSSVAPQESLPKAQEAADHALAIDDALAEAHTSLGIINMYHRWDWSAAERELRRGVALSPGDAAAHRWYGWFLGLMARYPEALAELTRARELDPLDVNVHGAIGSCFYWSRAHDTAIEEFLRALELDAASRIVRGFLVDAYVQAGRFREANEEVDRISDSTMMKNVVLGYAYGALGRRAEAAELVERLLESAQQRYIAPYHLAIVYAGLQDAEAALRWLERAYEERSVWLTWLKVEPKFDGLRADPRFADLMRRVGFASG